MREAKVHALSRVSLIKTAQLFVLSSLAAWYLLKSVFFLLLLSSLVVM